jgi:putative nucleotidyltransferase with HDIG domain
MRRGEKAAPGARWQRRWLAGLLVRIVTAVVPFVLAIGTISALGHLVPRPDGGLVVGWYAGICAVSWLVLWQAQRVLHRLLPLAGLLEMSLLFPDRAPSRLKLARRVASRRDLEQMLSRAGTPGQHESTQEAAERILVLVSALSEHDRATRGHSERVRVLSDLIAVRMGLSEHDRDRLRWAALLHDIGKLQVSTSLLNKPATPTPREWEEIRRHPHHGAAMAAPLLDWLESWGDVIVQHHEKWDGSGYPAGLAGTAICLGARIVAVADAFDVMTAARAYKKPSGRAAALRELVACSGAHFDPEVVRALITTPQHRLLATMGPLSWITGLPLIGQAPTALTATLASQATAALGAAALTGTTALTGAVMPASAGAAHQHQLMRPASTTRSATENGRTPRPSAGDLRRAAAPSGSPSTAAGTTSAPAQPTGARTEGTGTVHDGPTTSPGGGPTTNGPSTDNPTRRSHRAPVRRTWQRPRGSGTGKRPTSSPSSTTSTSGTNGNSSNVNGSNGNGNDKGKGKGNGGRGSSGNSNGSGKKNTGRP